MSQPGGIERSREELAAARLLADGGFAEQAISRAYYGAFHAATAALQALGESRSKHAGVVAAFERLVVRAGGIDPDAGRILRALFRQRQEADYGNARAPQAEADAALAEAELFVDAIEAWLSQRDG